MPYHFQKNRSFGWSNWTETLPETIINQFFWSLSQLWASLHGRTHSRSQKDWGVFKADSSFGLLTSSCNDLATLVLTHNLNIWLYLHWYYMHKLTFNITVHMHTRYCFEKRSIVRIRSLNRVLYSLRYVVKPSVWKMFEKLSLRGNGACSMILSLNMLHSECEPWVTVAQAHPSPAPSLS